MEDSKLWQFSYPEKLCAIGGEDVLWDFEVVFQEAWNIEHWTVLLLASFYTVIVVSITYIVLIVQKLSWIFW